MRPFVREWGGGSRRSEGRKKEEEEKAKTESTALLFLFNCLSPRRFFSSRVLLLRVCSLRDMFSLFLGCHHFFHFAYHFL